MIIIVINDIMVFKTPENNIRENMCAASELVSQSKFASSGLAEKILPMTILSFDLVKLKLKLRSTSLFLPRV